VDLFDQHARQAMAGEAPLAERMRPAGFDEFLGQPQITGPGAPVRAALAQDRLFSMIFWGPPGCGKTTLARLIAKETRSHFVEFSAVMAGIQQIRGVIEEARRQRSLHRRRTVLFVDEIHRFNKAQQDAFLPHVESGLIILIGATTENPSFEVIAALMSRCRVITLNPLSAESIAALLDRAVADTARGLGRLALTLSPQARDHLVAISDGDARAALNALEIAAELARSDPQANGCVGLEAVEKALQRKAYQYDKQGESHYNLISALHKSLRDSDPDAGLYWLARMLAAGEDPLYILRRMVRFASEDVGNADPQALGVALAAVRAFELLGHPEGELAIAQAAVYLATAPKSNRVYAAFGKANQVVEATGALAVPLHIRNAPTGLMKQLGYGRGYRYAHDFEHAAVDQNDLPQELAGQRFYFPSERGYEKTIAARMDFWRRLKQKVQK
jgi:putative ATPase